MTPSGISAVARASAQAWIIQLWARTRKFGFGAAGFFGFAAAFGAALAAVDFAAGCAGVRFAGVADFAGLALFPGSPVRVAGFGLAAVRTILSWPGSADTGAEAVEVVLMVSLLGCDL